ncbi:Gfo/Idh/MocA family oxidoreductase [bacterium]|nr:Gfo/Idh/MocA family oxidoreductase [bacterium]
MSGNVGIGIIGTGQIGKAHLNRYRDVPDARIVAVCDVNKDEAARVAAEYKVPHVFTDFRELLALKEIQAVDVCLHNNLHAPVAIAAMQAGKDVFCEKPLAGSYTDAHRMVETAHSTGRRLAMQLNNLFSNETLAAKRLIDEGHLGSIYYAKSSAYRRRGRPYVDGYGTSSFVQKNIAAAGALYDMGVYHICQVLYLLGNPAVLTVSGAAHQQTAMYEQRRKDGKYDVEELGIGFVRLDGGVTLFIEEAWAIHFGGTDGSKIAGSKGGVTLHPFSYHTTMADMEMDAVFSLDQARTRWERCFPDMPAYKHTQSHWTAALQGRVPLIPLAGLGLNMMLIAEGIFLSQKLGREVTADEVRAHSVSTAVSL